MTDDRELLARYVDEGSQEAFALIVDRYLNLVYASALRQVDHELAADVAQLVFVNLARKARTLPRHIPLAGWLHRDTRFTAIDLLRTEQRRRAREQEALAMNNLGPDSAADWTTIRPVLDAALDHLPTVDRDAVLLRYFEQRSLREVGDALGFSEEAARKRVARGLEKLRLSLARKGVHTTAAALSIALTANGSPMAPAGLASLILPAALAAGAKTAAGGLLAARITESILMTKLQLTTVSVIIAAALTTGFLQHQSAASLRAENAALQATISEKARQEAEVATRTAAVATSQPAGLTPDQMSELLRLRSQVGQLRSDLKGAQASRPGSAARPVAPEAGAATEPATAQPFTAELTARVPAGQSLITGGWNTAPGMRMFILVNPGGVASANAADGSVNPGQALLSSVIFEVPEKALTQLGLDQLTTAGAQSAVQGLLGAANGKSLLEALSNTEGVNILSKPRVQTSDGVAASISIGESSANPGEPASGHTIEFTPHVAADGSGVDLAMKAVIRTAKAKPGDR